MALGRKTGGRQKGTPNKATADIRELAQAFGLAAINRLAMMAGLAVDALGQPIKGAESEATQLAALNALLDRAYGKPTQPLEGDGDTAPQVIHFTWGKAGETDDAPVVDHEPVTTAPPLEAVPANANIDTDEVPRYVLRFAGDKQPACDDGIRMPAARADAVG